MTLANIFELAIEVSVITIADSPVNASEWQRQENTTQMDTGRLDADYWGFASASVRSDVVLDTDGSRPHVFYSRREAVPPILSEFAYFTHYTDRLDA